MKKYRTQKARGLEFLKLLGYAPTLPYKVAQDEVEVREHFMRLADMYGGEVYVRPCPEEPRHGFLDSVSCFTVDEALAVFRGAIAADPKAEVIMMPRIVASTSGIYTPSVITLGPGHNGATAGIKALDLAVGSFELPKDVLASAGIKTFPFLETVTGSISGGNTDTRTYAVQLRDGPVLPGPGNFIPRPMTVGSIYLLPEDPQARIGEFEWESFVKTLPKDCVVYHPGGGIGTHYAIHAKLADLAIFFDRQPEIGEELTVDKTDEDRYFPLHMRAGLEVGMAVQDILWKDALNVALIGLHEGIANENFVGSKIMGIAASLITRLSTATCLGELRWRPEYRRKGSPLAGTDHSHESRHKIFERAWKDPFYAQKFMPIAAKSFFLDNWSGSYGGRAWAACTYMGIRLFDAIVAFHKAPTIANQKLVIGALNAAINTAHNNGWQFNKFAPEGKVLMDRAAAHHPGFIIGTMDAIYRLMNIPREDVSPLESARKTRGLTALNSRMKAMGLSMEKIVAEEVEKAKQKNSNNGEEGCSCDECTGSSDEDYDEESSVDGKQVTIDFCDLGKCTQAQVWFSEKNMHFQFKFDNLTHFDYLSADVPLTEISSHRELILGAYAKMSKVESFSGSGNVKYVPLNVVYTDIFFPALPNYAPYLISMTKVMANVNQCKITWDALMEGEG